MALVVRVFGVTASELWIADATWKRAQHLTTHTGGSVTDVAWSPDEKNLAFIGWSSFLPGEKPSDTRLFVVRRQSGDKTLIAQGAVAPRWTPDGKFLLFLRFVGGKWQPYRASHFSNAPKLELISDLMLDQPGAFSPDGGSVAGVLDNDLVTETLETHTRTATAFGGILEGLTWSSDAGWLLAKVNYENLFPPVMGRNPDGDYYAINPNTGKSVDWESRLAIPHSPKKGEVIFVTDGSWIPGIGHRLLLWAVKWTGMGSDLYLPEDGRPSLPQGQWLIYDIDTGSSVAIKDLPSYDSGFGFPNVGLVWSTQGTYLGVNQGAVSAEEYGVTWH